jgi:hypothetical protein
MKTSSILKRLSALILTSNIAVFTAFAVGPATPATNEPAAKHHLSVGHASAAKKSVPHAKTGGPTTSANSEPDRIYDLRTREFISNPDYHEPPRLAAAKQTGQRAEPRRIFNPVTRNFEINPDYHEPAGAMEGTRRSNREAEPDRIFDPETRNFEPNPAFGIRW